MRNLKPGWETWKTRKSETRMRNLKQEWEPWNIDEKPETKMINLKKGWETWNTDEKPETRMRNLKQGWETWNKNERNFKTYCNFQTFIHCQFLNIPNSLILCVIPYFELIIFNILFALCLKCWTVRLYLI